MSARDLPQRCRIEATGAPADLSASMSASTPGTLHATATSAETVPAPGEVVEFSALVAAWNEAEMIERHIASFDALGLPNCQLILCAGGTDDTYAIARKAAGPNVIVIEQTPGMGKQAALRVCLRQASRPYIYLTDADCLLDRHALAALSAPLLAGRYRVATGGSTPIDSQLGNPLIQYQASRNLRRQDQLGDETDGILGRNALLARATVDDIGAFEDDVQTGTDYHMSKRLVAAGIPIAHVKASNVLTVFPATGSDYVRRWRRWIKNLVIHDPRRHARAFATAVILACAVLLAPLALFVLPWWLAMPFVLLFLAALVPRYRDLRHGLRAGVRVSPESFLLTPGFLLLDQVAVLAALLDLSSARTRRRW